MRVAVFEYGIRDYITRTFSAHPGAQLACFLEINPEGSGETAVPEGGGKTAVPEGGGKTAVPEGGGETPAPEKGGEAGEAAEIPVRPLSSLGGGGAAEYDAVLLALASDVGTCLALEYLHDLGVENLWLLRRWPIAKELDFLTDEGFCPDHVDRIPGTGGKPYIPHVEAHVCDRCNLNCKACNHFAPFVRQDELADSGQFARDLERLAELAEIGRMILLGGEPLLEPDLCAEMVRAARSILPRAQIHITTNATLIPQMTPSFWNCLQENGVILTISLYPPVRGRLPEIQEVVERYAVRYELLPVTAFFKRLTLYPFEDAAYNSGSCISGGCHYLRGGFIYKCPDAWLVGYMADAMGTVPEALRSRDGIRLKDVADGWEMVRQLNRPCGLCKRCTIERMENIPWQAAGASPNPADWLLEDRLSAENRLLWQYAGELEREVERLRTASQTREM